MSGGDRDSRHGWLIGLLVMPILMLCCIAPAAVAAVASLGLGAWLAAHGLWLLAVCVIAVAVVVTGWWLLRRRNGAECSLPLTGMESGQDRHQVGHRARKGDTSQSWRRHE